MSSAINTRGSRHSFTTIATLRGASPEQRREHLVNRQGTGPCASSERRNQQASGHQQQATGYQAAGRSNLQATSPRLAAHQPDQHRRAEKGAHHRYPQFAGHQQAANHVGKQQQGRGGEQGDRQRPAMIGPHQPARAICGIIRPIKAMGPTTAVALPHWDGDDDQADQLGAGDAAAEGGGGIVAGLRLLSARLSSRAAIPRHHYRQQDNFQRLQGADIQRTGLPEA